MTRLSKGQANILLGPNRDAARRAIDRRRVNVLRAFKEAFVLLKRAEVQHIDT